MPVRVPTHNARSGNQTFHVDRSGAWERKIAAVTQQSKLKDEQLRAARRQLEQLSAESRAITEDIDRLKLEQIAEESALEGRDDAHGPVPAKFPRNEGGVEKQGANPAPLGAAQQDPGAANAEEDDEKDAARALTGRKTKGRMGRRKEWKKLRRQSGNRPADEDAAKKTMRKFKISPNAKALSAAIKGKTERRDSSLTEDLQEETDAIRVEEELEQAMRESREKADAGLREEFHLLRSKLAADTTSDDEVAELTANLLALEQESQRLKAGDPPRQFSNGTQSTAPSGGGGGDAAEEQGDAQSAAFAQLRAERDTLRAQLAAERQRVQAHIADLKAENSCAIDNLWKGHDESSLECTLPTQPGGSSVDSSAVAANAGGAQGQTVAPEGGDAAAHSGMPGELGVHKERGPARAEANARTAAPQSGAASPPVPSGGPRPAQRAGALSAETPAREADMEAMDDLLEKLASLQAKEKERRSAAEDQDKKLMAAKILKSKARAELKVVNQKLAQSKTQAEEAQAALAAEMQKSAVLAAQLLEFKAAAAAQQEAPSPAAEQELLAAKKELESVRKRERKLISKAKAAAETAESATRRADEAQEKLLGYVIESEMKVFDLKKKAEYEKDKSEYLQEKMEEQADASQAQISALTAELADAQGNASELQKEIDALSSQLSDTSCSTASQSEELQKLRALVEKRTAEKSELRANLQNLSQQLSIAESTVTEGRQVIGRLESAVDEKDTELQRAIAEKEALLLEVEDVEDGRIAPIRSSSFFEPVMKPDPILERNESLVTEGSVPKAAVDAAPGPPAKGKHPEGVAEPFSCMDASVHNMSSTSDSSVWDANEVAKLQSAMEAQVAENEKVSEKLLHLEANARISEESHKQVVNDLITTRISLAQVQEENARLRKQMQGPEARPRVSPSVERPRVVERSFLSKAMASPPPVRTRKPGSFI